MLGRRGNRRRELLNRLLRRSPPHGLEALPESSKRQLGASQRHVQVTKVSVGGGEFLSVREGAIEVDRALKEGLGGVGVGVKLTKPNLSSTKRAFRDVSLVKEGEGSFQE